MAAGEPEVGSKAGLGREESRSRRLRSMGEEWSLVCLAVVGAKTKALEQAVRVAVATVRRFMAVRVVMVEAMVTSK
jgi:hypothetical protein